MDAKTGAAHKFALGVRLAIIVVFIGWAWQGPYRRRVLEHKGGLTWGYMFYRAQGKAACDLRYYEPKDGGLEYVERWKVLGYDRPQDMPRNLRIVGPNKRIPSHTALLCRELREQRGEPVELRAHISCPNWTSWTEIEDGKRDVCKPKKKRKKNKKKKGSSK